MVNPARIRTLSSCLGGKRTDHSTRQSVDTCVKNLCILQSTESLGFLSAAGTSVGGFGWGSGYYVRFFMRLHRKRPAGHVVSTSASQASCRGSNPGEITFELCTPDVTVLFRRNEQYTPY